MDFRIRRSRSKLRSLEQVRGREALPMLEPQFSVITIALNNLSGFMETKASTEVQSFRDFQWIIIDGGSNDGTPELLRLLVHSNLAWVSEPDRGLYDAMNKGLNLANGRYIIFMNSGDRFADKDVLKRVDGLIAQTERPDFIFGDAFEENAKGQLLLKRAMPPREIRRGMFTHHQAMIYARKTIGEARYDLRFRVAADYHLTCRMFAKGIRTIRTDFPICVNKRAGFSEKNARIGRRENIAIQKEVLQVGLVRRAYNYASFVTCATLRTHMRGLYDRIRFRQDNQVSDVG
jgi:putative colanic acid biosynthesis glycosyltransferase